MDNLRKCINLNEPPLPIAEWPTCRFLLVVLLVGVFCRSQELLHYPISHLPQQYVGIGQRVFGDCCRLGFAGALNGGQDISFEVTV